MQFPPPQEHNCTNRTHTYTTTTPERQVPARALGDFAGGFAPAGAVMTQQFSYPGRWDQAPRLVRLGEQCGDCAPELHCLLGREVHGQLIQQADELAHVRRARGRALGGEPALQPSAGCAAGRRAPQEIAQPVRAHTRLSRQTSQGEPRRLASEPVPQQGDRQCRGGWACRHWTPARCPVRTRTSRPCPMTTPSPERRSSLGASTCSLRRLVPPRTELHELHTPYKYGSGSAFVKPQFVRRLRWRFCLGAPGTAAGTVGPSGAGRAGASRTPPRGVRQSRARVASSAEGKDPPRAHRASGRADRCSGGADRKSTRLNSSHRTISYAGFCLKKKNGREGCLDYGEYKDSKWGSA